VDSLRGKRILVTGGNGFLGKFVVARLKTEGASDVYVLRKRSYNLCSREAVSRLYSETRPQIVIHLAASVGGIGANRENPGKFFYENMAMGLHVIEEARCYGCVEKLVMVGTTCSYPKHTRIPFQEEDLWSGYPEETNAPYAIAKKALFVMAQSYREQFGLNTICLIPANLYGPGDNFDPQTSHVIPALIRKFVEAKQSGARSVEVWGTGNVSREFLYVEDAAVGIVLATLRYDRGAPINLGTGFEISIRDLVNKIREIAGYVGDVTWNHSKPDGQPRRKLDVRKALQEFNFQAQTDLNSGISATVEWYQKCGRDSGRDMQVEEVHPERESAVTGD
jgi:GDP-L-fucose synthase